MVKMTSFEVIHSDRDCNESSMDSVEFSFLPNPPSMSPGSETASYNVRDLQSTLLVATPDLTMDEVQHRLLDMLRENEELKEALKKNNVMMNEQLSIVSSWHEQMLQAKNKQQAKIDEATKLISELKKQNEELVLKIKDLDIKIEECTKIESCSKCTEMESVLSNLEMEKQNLIKEKEELCTELNQQKLFHKQLENNISSISSYLENLQSNSKLLVEEKRELTALNNELQVQLVSLSCGEPVVISDEEFGYTVISHPRTEKIDALKDTLLQLHELEEKVSDLTRQLKEKDIEITSFKQKTTDQKQDILKFQEEQKMQEEAVKASYELTQNKLEIATSLSQKYKDRCDSLQQHMDEHQAKLEQMKMSDSYVIEQLQDEVKNLQEVLKFEQTNNEEDKKKLVDAEKNMKLLSNEFETVKKLLDIQAQEQKEKSNISNSSKEIEDRKHLEEIDGLTAKLINSEQELEAQQEKVQELVTELGTLKQDAESIPILKSQIELYKIDFENEKTAKESAQNMADALEQKIKLLEEAARDSLGNRKHSRRKSGAEAEPAGSGVFVCPLCGRTFNDAKTVENHASRCSECSPLHF